MRPDSRARSRLLPGPVPAPDPARCVTARRVVVGPVHEPAPGVPDVLAPEGQLVTDLKG